MSPPKRLSRVGGRTASSDSPWRLLGSESVSRSLPGVVRAGSLALSAASDTPTRTARGGA